MTKVNCVVWIYLNSLTIFIKTKLNKKTLFKKFLLDPSI